MKTTKLGILCACALAFATLAGVSRPANAARSAMASQGRPMFEGGEPGRADEFCFPLFNSAATNKCPGEKLYDIPIMVDRTGWWSAFVAVKAANRDDVKCQLVAVDHLGEPNSTGELKGCGPGTCQIRLEGHPFAVHVSADGAAYVSCRVRPGATIKQVTYW